MNNNTLANKEIIYFYKLLLKYEEVISKQYQGFKYKKIEKFLKQHFINLDFKSPVESHSEKNKIIFSHYTSICACFIRHIRNAFAHGMIEKQKNFYIIIDYDRKRKKYTMYGRVNKELLPKLIEEMENSRS